MDQRGSAQYTKNTKAKLLQIVYMFKKLTYLCQLFKHILLKFKSSVC